MGTAVFQSIVCYLYRKGGEDPEITTAFIGNWMVGQGNKLFFCFRPHFLVAIVNGYSYSQVSS